MRDTTEYPEAVSARAVKLVGTDKATIVSEANRPLDDHTEYHRMNCIHSPSGDVNAANKITDFLLGQCK